MRLAAFGPLLAGLLFLLDGLVLGGVFDAAVEGSFRLDAVRLSPCNKGADLPTASTNTASAIKFAADDRIILLLGNVSVGTPSKHPPCWYTRAHRRDTWILAQNYTVLFDVTAQDTWLAGPDMRLWEDQFVHKRYDPTNSSTAHIFANQTFDAKERGRIGGDLVSDSLTIAGTSLSITEQCFGVGDRSSDGLALFESSPASGVLGLSPLPGLTPNNVSSVWSNLRPQLQENVLSLWIEP